MTYGITVNGLGHAFLREFGCPCNRCTLKEHAANTSVSIFRRDNDGAGIEWHALIDAGLGVVTSLCNYFRPEDARLDWLLFTHWHPDHSLELNRLCETTRRSARYRSEPYVRIPTWCREGTSQWLKKTYSYEWHRCLDPRIFHETAPPGTILESVPLDLPDMTVTPVSVSHYSADIDPVTFKDTLYSSASFVVETDRKKAVLLWDIDNHNEWIVSPETDEQNRAVSFLSNADYLFIDCFTWAVEEVRGYNTGHISFSTVQRYAKALSPRETMLMHISGHEEGEGNDGWGWSDEQWEREAQNIWKSKSLPGTVRVPSIGETLQL
ncbi:MAG: MBL fold metallo-hydrolase [Deltaproteobacteria bacterium]|nr:MBL fold metallo-hydrolase [Deltaproteobacteria bacterium]MBN2687762.1 MBL fold metallo-hydrolase [Deltaproteobacteria bacterium]